MIEKYHTGGGCMAYMVTDSSALGLVALVTCDGQLPDEPETDEIDIGVYPENEFCGEHLTMTKLIGRQGLIAWYIENVGHDPDADQGSPISILELMEQVAQHLLFRAVPQF